MILQYNGSKLIIKESKLNHQGHSLDQQTYDHYPENVRLSNEQIENVEKLISVGANKRKIKINVMKDTGKPVLMKSIHNIQTKMQQKTQNGDGNSLQKLYDVMATIPGAKVRFISNEKNEFVGKFEQLESERNAVNKVTL